MKKFLFFLILILSVLASCSKTETNSNANQSSVNAATVEKTRVYVNADWLKSVIDGNQPQSSNYVILEASWGDASADYKKAHIPGALHINTDLIEEPEYWNVRTPKEIEQVMKDFGISKDTAVIVYGEPSPAARVATTLLWAGVDEVHVLDGNLKAWTDMGYATSSNTEKAKPIDDVGVIVPAHPEYIISLPEQIIEKQKDPNFKLVSIRSWDEFTGKVSGYSYIERVGEPKGAVWGRDEFDYVDDNGKIISIDEAQKIWNEWGVTKDNEISFYCGTGWRAAIPFLIAYQEGWTNVTLFDGGWYVWQMNPELPVQLGDPRENTNN
ncbi:rhodanese-like domain-containing protein [Brachyspira innocens]|uniref:Rhodanese-like domain-containing protein n=1 Tax=Brachyspira innocens TaxID=13264 RepID=A0ABT8YXA4_9SPIR|nr:rhodanese-like domain-containing protein [Brachyspira innocens]MDO6994931.1 rhodanese-like domain-containing protein [Brachyspira innocens]MDO7019862.1 rhodanese-like domain-containing protein [Brachyspira innocens]